ncbi:MAG: aminoacyl-tRNA hydrolase [Armatimonadota bacterium]
MRFFRRQPTFETVRHLIVGLGNPGAQYHNTRHNIGFRVVDLLAERHRIDTRKVERQANFGRGAIGETVVALAKPLTYMNLSGESVAPLARLLQLRPEEIIVVVDDMDLPPGRIRIRPSGSAGGHNGLKSLIQHLGTTEFPRVRVGVGRPSGPKGGTVDHVLGKFTREELEPVQDSIRAAADAVEAIVTDGLQAAMNRFNPAGTPATE